MDIVKQKAGQPLGHPAYNFSSVQLLYLFLSPICNVFDLHEDFIVKFDEIFVF